MTILDLLSEKVGQGIPLCSYTEGQRKVTVMLSGFMAGFGARDGSFYDLLWGRGILVSMTCLGWGGLGLGAGDRNTEGGQTELGSEAASQAF